jgi:hypothetical protein
LNPVFSGDGHTLVWDSWAGDLTAPDFSQWCNLFALQAFATNTYTNGQAFVISAVSFPGSAHAGSPAVGPTLSWPAVPGAAYQVQFKNNLTDAYWQNLTNTVQISGGQASLMDLVPATGQRFYRLVAY